MGYGCAVDNISMSTTDLEKSIHVGLVQQRLNWNAMDLLQSEPTTLS